MSSILAPPQAASLAGAIVARRFTLGAEVMLRGRELTREQLVAMPRANFAALVENRFIQPIMARPGQMPAAEPPKAPKGALKNMAPIDGSYGRRSFMIGFGKYTVIDGTVIAERVTKEEAMEMIAAGPVPLAPTVTQEAAPQRAPIEVDEPVVDEGDLWGKDSSERGLGRGIESLLAENDVGKPDDGGNEPGTNGGTGA